MCTRATRAAAGRILGIARGGPVVVRLAGLGHFGLRLLPRELSAGPLRVAVIGALRLNRRWSGCGALLRLGLRRPPGG